MDAMTLRTAPAPVHLTSHVHSTGAAAAAAASAACSRSSLQPVVVRPLRTLNNIHQTPHVIQLRPDCFSSPNLSGKRKTAVELLEESKAFYVKTERVLDRKQELPHGYVTMTTVTTTGGGGGGGNDRLLPGQLQLHPNRSPMLSLPSARIRDHYHEYPPPPPPVKDDNNTTINILNSAFSLTAAAAAGRSTGNGGGGSGGGNRQQREGYFTTPPVEKRRLSIRKDNPLPLNVTAVKRFLSRAPGSTQENLQVIRRSKTVTTSTTSQSSSSAKLLMGLFGDISSSSSSSRVDSQQQQLQLQQQQTKKVKQRSAFSEVLPCICRQSTSCSQSDKMKRDQQQQQQSTASSSQTSPPPQLPLRKTYSSPPPPLPPKSPALNAKLLLLSQEQNCYQQNTLSSRGGDHSKSQKQQQQQQQQQQYRVSASASAAAASIKDNPPFRRFQSEETPNNNNNLTLSVAAIITTATAEFPVTRVGLRHHTTRHKSLPDLNSPKNSRRRGIYGGVDGKIRSASTDLDSDSGSGRSSSPSISSSVRLDSGGSSTSSEAESYDQRHMRRGCRMPSSGGAKSERATTSDYASRSPSFKYETTSLVQTSQRWSLPPWQDDSGVDGGPSSVAMATKATDCVTQSVGRGLPAPSTTTAAVTMTTSLSAEQVRRRAILRSKSDVGPSRFAPDLLPAVPAEFTGDVPIDLDIFFDTIGEPQGLLNDSSPNESSGRSSPVYFSSVSSVDSCCKRRVHVDNVYESSDSEDPAATLQRRLLGSQPGMGEPSIVERNARIIKWLIKCRNVPAISIPVSGSIGQLSLTTSTSTTIIGTSQQQRQSQQLPSPPPNKVFAAAAITNFYGQSTRL